MNFEAVREVGPQALGPSCCRVAWRHFAQKALVNLERARLDETTAVGRLAVPWDFQLVLETYFPLLEVS